MIAACWTGDNKKFSRDNFPVPIIIPRSAARQSDQESDGGGVIRWRRMHPDGVSSPRNWRARSLIVAPSYSSVGPSGAVGVTRRGPIVSNLAEAGLAMRQGVCFSRGVNFQRRPSTTNLGGSRETTSDRISSRRLAWMTDNEPSVCILIAGSTIRTSPGHPAPLKTTKRIKQKGR